ncbi:hypothetical protein LWI28_020405 [Acer negundo]|uniref:Uncharacterized protein n=1 Tax=Acer negundo TaxID=4023 RepID=A0AAD5P2K8_ACENE|nr:hypothetical protein LWI28_020405 [Acer negundo]
MSPLLTLHHFDAVEPIFPSKDRSESINHLMKAAKFDQSRVLQQTICYHLQSNWTFSISWGYSAHVYERIFPRSILRRPLETFMPWQTGRPPLFMFNTRWPSSDPCEAPHVFFLENVYQSSEQGDQVVSVYTRKSARDMGACSLNGNHSADPISRIQVSSPAVERKEAGRIECCDVEYETGKEIASVKFRACMKGEMLPY